MPEWDDAPATDTAPVPVPPTVTTAHPIAVASAFADGLKPMVRNLAAQMRTSCTMPWAAMRNTFSQMAELVASVASFSTTLGIAVMRDQGEPRGDFSHIVGDLVRELFLMRPDELRSVSFSTIFSPVPHILDGGVDTVYVLNLRGWLQHLAQSNSTVWARMLNPPQPSESGELSLPTDGSLWRRIRGSADTLCVVLSIDGMNWADALRVGGHNGKTIAVYITVVLGPEFLSYSSTYSVAMFAPVSLLERHSRAELFRPLMQQLAQLAGGTTMHLYSYICCACF